jgi:hemerythrin-like domain-containing protein
MQATEVLRHEHRVIEIVMEGLGRLAGHVDSGKPLDREQAAKALEIIANFVDRCHHTKEEQHLFPLMTKHGMPTETGPLFVMLREHEEGRAHVRAMREAATDAPFAAAAHAYTNLLRSHIYKEDNVLYPMAERMLNDQDDAQLLRDFDEVERLEMGEGVHEKYHQWAHELATG